MSILVTTGLTKRYGAITALRDVHLALEGAQVVGLPGENGCGNTTWSV